MEDRTLLSRFSEFAIPTASSGPRDIVAGPDGNLWFTEQQGLKIGWLNPQGTFLGESGTSGSWNSGPQDITVGSDGNLWYTVWGGSGGAKFVGQITTGGQVTEFGTRLRPYSITSGPDGNLWFTMTEIGSSSVAAINPVTHAITEYHISTTTETYPQGITTGSDGNIWFTNYYTNQIGQVVVSTGKVNLFSITTSGSGPAFITNGPDGALWFTEESANQIGRFDVATQKVTDEIPVPTAGSGPYGIKVGPDGNLWFTEVAGNKVGVLNPSTRAFEEFAIPTPNSQPYNLATGPDNNIWFVESNGNNVGRLNRPVLSPISDQTVNEGSLLTFTATATDTDTSAVLTYSLDSAPVGAAIDRNTGVFTYTPAEDPATYSVTVRVTDNGTPALSDTKSFNITVNELTAQLSVNAPPSATAGSAFTFNVTALEPDGDTATGYNGTVHFTSSDPRAILPADYSFTSTDSGVHTFSGTLKTAGPQTVTATDTVTSTIAGSASLTVLPAAASTLLVGGFPSPSISGQAQGLAVIALDAFANVATSYAGTVHFTSTDAAAALPADYTFQASDAGGHTFSATLETAGTQSLTATDNKTSSITGAQAGILVKPAKFLVTGFASTTTAGVAHSFTVTAQNANGTTATGYTGTVHFTSSDGQATLPADYTFTSTDAGVHTFSATLKTAGAQSLTASDTVVGAVTGSQSGITVNPAAASTLLVAGFPSLTTAGVAQSFTVTAKDAYGNLATGYSGTVHFTSSDSKAVLPSNYTFVAGDAGVHSFSATLKTAGSRSITATDTVTATIKGTQNGITVNPAAASQLQVSGASSATAGTAFSVTVTAKDPYGNTATQYTGTVHFSSSDSQATLPSNYTFTSSDAGRHTFANGATLKTAGKQTLTATDTVTASITGSATVNVTAAAASTLSLSAPATVTAGTAFTLTVTALDPYGNRATGYRGTVHFTSSDPKAVLPADYPFTASDNGVHSFSRAVTLKTAGTQSITATDTVTSTITGQASIKVSAAAASILVVSGFPSPIAHGTVASLTVTAEDAYGNIATGYLGTVHFTSSDTAASLPTNYTFTATDAGVHTFSATLNTAGTQTITATDKLNLSITGAESGIQVTAAAVERLFGSELLDPEEAGATINPFEDGRSAAVAVVFAELLDGARSDAGTRSRLTEALFSSPPYPGDPRQEASVSAGGLAVLAGAYGFVASRESDRRRDGVP